MPEGHKFSISTPEKAAVTTTFENYDIETIFKTLMSGGQFQVL